MVDVLEAPARTSAPLTAPPKAPSSTPSSAGAKAPPTEATPGPSRNLLVILHGKRVEDDLLRQALQEVKQQGHQMSVRVTFDRGDVEHFIAEAVKLNDAGTTNYQTIVAGGGDGTLNEVVSALMQHREAVARQGLSLALIPLGTANDFACTAGISVDPREALRVALDPSLIRPIDVATVNGRPFLNVAVAGGVADVPPDELSSKWKRLLGPLAIAFYVLKRLSSKRVLAPHAGTTISFNPQPAHPNTPQHTPHKQGKEASGTQQQDQPQQQQQQRYEFQTDLLMLVSGNSRQMGRTVAVCPDALLDDGLIDFTLLSGSSLAAQAAALVSALASGDDNDPVHDSGICQLRASHLEVLAATDSSSSSSSNGGGGGGDLSKGGEAIPVNRDGEPEAASHRLVFEVLRRVLPMHLPDDRLLVSGQAQAAAAGGSGGAGGVRGSIKQPGKEGFLPATAAVPAAAAGEPAGSGSASGEQQGRRKGGRRRQHRGLTVKTLRRMLAVASPEGQGVRRNAHLAALGRKLAVSLGVVLLGGVLGWSVGGAKAAKGQEEEQQGSLRVGRVGAEPQLEERQPRHEKVLKRRQASKQVSAAAIV